MLEFLYQHLSLQTMIWLIVGLPLAGALVNALLAVITARSEGSGFRRLVAFVGSLFPLLAFLVTVIVFLTLTGFPDTPPSAITGPLFRWLALPGLIVEVGLKVDQLSLMMALMVTAVGALVHIYSVGYMWHDDGFARYFAQLNLFLAFMLLLVLADNLVLLFIAWEGVGLCSYLLIGFWFDEAGRAQAAMKAFVVNAIGDAGLLAALMLIYGVMQAAGAPSESSIYNLETLARYSATFMPVATPICLLLFLGAAAKSAQGPLYVWLPDAMVGPTPVSALIHAATMVAAGVYLVVRLNFLFIFSPTALWVVAVIGAVSALLAALMGLEATDLKRILAYSTISQLGFMFVAVGIGAFSAAIFHLIAHALFKALLFLAAGSAIMALGGESDIRRMGGLKRRMPLTTWCFVIGAACLAGIAPFSGFFSKDAILTQAYERGYLGLWIAGFLGSGLTAFYIFRAAGSVFFGETQAEASRFKRAHEPGISMVVPVMLLATLATAAGVMGIPKALGGGEWLATWLSNLIPSELSRAPSEASHGVEIVLMAVTLLWNAHFAVLGWLIYAQKRDWPQRVVRRVRILTRCVAQGFYIDLIYDRLLVRPLIACSRNLLWKGLDKTVVDGVVVDGAARSVGLMAAILSAAQTGTLQHYLLYFLIGAVILVGLVAL